MANKPHLYFKNPQEGVSKYKQSQRYIDSSKDKVVKNYKPLKTSFRNSINNFYADKQDRETKRNKALKIPKHIDYLEIDFFSSFNSADFENKYIRDFGLSIVRQSDFNRKVLFAITDEDKFTDFIKELKKFISTPENPTVINYNPIIVFIKEFSLFSTGKIIQYDRLHSLITIKMVDNSDIYYNLILPVQNSLIEYLKNKDITFDLNTENNIIELTNIPGKYVVEIANNFDIIQSINSHLTGIIRPNIYNLPERTFGFEITNGDESLPIIGVMDTGISNATPLKALLVNRNSTDFDITGTGVFSDNVNHGTGVAALASIGKVPYPSFRGNFKASAKLLSLKILNKNGESVSSQKEIDLIEKAYYEFGVKIFVLTITYNDFKKNNSLISDYAAALDRLSNKLDIIIVISVGNNKDLSIIDGKKAKPVKYPEHFLLENANLLSPSESMNNLSVGAIANNLEDILLSGITPHKNFPAIYTRKYHLSLEDKGIKRNHKNKHLFKPDILECGGDYDSILDYGTDFAMRFLSAIPGEYYSRGIGTSYSAPLIANLAARIIGQYPDMTMQTVKALIINSAVIPQIGTQFKAIPKSTQRHIFGNGIPEDDNCIFSNENRITFILEDTIKPGYIKSFPLVLPAYLHEIQSTKNLLEVTATLCFKFKPIQNNHLAYCPLHITFAFGKNLPLETNTQKRKGTKITDRINDSTIGETLLHTWAQEYYYRDKPLSNTQKIQFKVNKEQLINEDNKFKVVVNSKLHKLLNQVQKTEYDIENPFSLVITIREIPIDGNVSGKLYDEMVLKNKLTAFAEAEADAELEV